MKILRHRSANKFLKYSIYVAFLSLFINAVSLVSFNAFAEDVVENPSSSSVQDAATPAPEVSPETSPVVPAVDGGSGSNPSPKTEGTVTPEAGNVPSVDGGVLPTPEVLPESSSEISPVIPPLGGENGSSSDGSVTPVPEVSPEPPSEVSPVVPTIDGGDVSETLPKIEGSASPADGNQASIPEVPSSSPSVESDATMEFLKEKISDQLQKDVKLEEIVPISIEPQNEVHEVINVDPNAVHSCAFGSFAVAISEGQSFEVAMYLAGGDSNKTSVLKIGELPLGIGAKFVSNSASILSGSLSDSEILLNVNADMGAQKGSFNFPVIFTQVDTTGFSSTNVCQLNLIVQ